MRFGRNILILSLLIVLLAAGLVTERLLRPAPPLAAGAPLFPVPPETIVSVRWDLPGAEGAAAGTLALRREGERWRMESPYPGATCDPAAVADLLDALQALRVGSRLGLTEGSAFRVTRRLEVRTAEAVYAAGFGGAQPMALAQTLAEVDGALVSVEAAAVARLPQTAEPLRAKTLLTWPAERVEALEWRAPGVPFTRADRQAGGVWGVSRPFPFEVKPEAADRALTTLAAPGAIAAYVRPADGRPPREGAPTVPEGALEGYGLDEETALRLSVFVRGAEGAQTFRFGKADPAHPGHVFCLIESDRAVVSVPGAIPALFAEGGPFVADFRDLPVLGALHDADRVAFRRGPDAAPVELSRSRGAWTLALPTNLPADAAAVSAMLSGLSALTGEITGSEEPAGEPFLTLTAEAGGLPLAALRLHPDPTDAAMALAWRPDQGRLYRIRRAALPSALLGDAARRGLVDRTVLSVSAGQIRRVTALRRDGTQCAAVRRGPALAWETESPAGAYVDATVLDAWIAAFADLKARRVLSDAPVAFGELGRYGLERPLLRLTLDLDDAEGLRRVLLVGEPDAKTGAAPALIQGRPVLYELDAETVRLLRRWPMREAR